MGNLIIDNGSALVRGSLKSLEKRTAKAVAGVIVNAYVLGINVRKYSSNLYERTKPNLKKGCIEYGKSICELVFALTDMIKENKKRIISAFALTLMGGVICTIVTVMSVFMLGIYSNYNFTTENWKKYSTHRTKMVGSLEQKYDIVGMNSSDIEQLLGLPYSMETKSTCEYVKLRELDFDNIVEYRLNKGSMSPMDLIEKHYAIAYKDGTAVWADVIVSDVTD